MTRAGVTLGLCVLAVGGCLDDAAEFAPQSQIAPFVVSGEVEPPLGAIYTGPVPFSMNVPFRSEDVNVDLEWRVFLDLPPGAQSQIPIEYDVVPAGTYDDVTRSVSLDWTVPLEEGCHTLTMILTYAGNYDFRTSFPLDESLATRVVWYVRVGDPDVPISLNSCPSASQSDLPL